MAEGAIARPTTSGPLTERGRVEAMDVARGFALLGIFCVNIECFQNIFAELAEHRPPAGPMSAVISHYFVTIFCQGKFYTLFSMLFGMGLVLQRGRAVEAGRNFNAMYLRRLAALFLIGLGHALLLWYGDILFIYSIVGVLLFLCSGFRAKTLAIIGGTVLLVSTLIGTAMMGLMLAGQNAGGAAKVETPAAVSTDGGTPDTSAAPAQDAAPAAGDTAKPDAATTDAAAQGASPTAAPAEAKGEDWGGFEKTPAGRVMADFANQGERPSEIMKEAARDNKPPFGTSLWREAETEAFRDGPYSQAFAFRAMIWAFIVVIMLFGFGWSVVAMFFLGAALGKWNILGREHRKWHVRFALMGLLVGLPMSVAAALIPAYAHGNTGAMMAMGLMSFIGQPAMALGYAGAMALLAYSNGFTLLKTLLASTGRMALTNYLSQTTIATFVFYHWGLKQFGSWSHAEGLGLVFAVFVCQMLISTWWLKQFRFGPMEWLWRSATYWEWQPMRR